MSPVVSHDSIAMESRSLSLVELEDAAEPFAHANTPDDHGRGASGERDDVADALMVALGVIVLDVLSDHVVEVPGAKGDNVPKALLPDRPHEPLGVVSQDSIAMNSRSLSLVELEDAAEPFAHAHTPDDHGRGASGKRDDVAEALMVALGMVVLDVLSDQVVEVPGAKGDNVPKALLSD